MCLKTEQHAAVHLALARKSTAVHLKLEARVHSAPHPIAENRALPHMEALVRQAHLRRYAIETSLTAAILCIWYFTCPWAEDQQVFQHSAVFMHLELVPGGGPNVVGFIGLLQPIADGLKLIVKEPIIPTNANVLIFLTAPVLSFVCSTMAWAYIIVTTTEIPEKIFPFYR
jgi:hypothetical protein